jgi:acetoin utilization deacetylase AcuC-like enzyme
MTSNDRSPADRLSPPSCRVGYAYSPAFLEHITDLFGTHGEAHPEGPDRLIAINHAVEDAGLDRELVKIEPRAATRGQLQLVHESTMIDRVEALAAQGGGLVDEDTVVSSGSMKSALVAAGAGIVAVDHVIGRQLDRAFVAVRPPGHHATASRSMGFCLFNNAAVAAAHALSHHGLKRVAIVDWDLHHGNGTQDIFYHRADVFYASLHQHPLYPGTGAARETGEGEGLGTTLNIPLPAGSGDELFLEKMRRVIVPAVRRYQPQLLMISSGFDAHAADPLGQLEVTESGFRRMTDLVVELAVEVCDGRIVSFLEGGYDLAALGRSACAHLEGLLARSA